MEQYKGLMIILDGIGDRPNRQLKGLTPLEAAITPNLDALASSGMCGFIAPLGGGMPVGTQVGVGLLMGVAMQDLPLLTRGPVEAAGVGLELLEGDIAVRCNFATFEKNGAGLTLLDRRAGRIAEQTEELAAALDGLVVGDGVQFRFKPATQHRAVLLLKGDGLSPDISDTDPGAARNDRGLQVSEPLRKDDRAALRTADVINTFVHKAFEILDGHPVNERRRERGLLPANGFLTRGAGMVKPLHNLVRHLGVQAAVVAGEFTILGLAKLFGFRISTDPRFTGDADTDLDEKVAAAQRALEENDLVFLHIKASDLFAHDLDPTGKARFIERIDHALQPLFKPDLVIGVTGDHTTDANEGRHTSDPVPACLYAPTSRRDAVTTFSEQDCMSGGLGHLSPTVFLARILDLMNRTRNYRPADQVFFP